MEKGKPYLLLLLVRAVACSVAATTVAVAAAFAAMRTAAFPHGGVLSVAVCVRMSFAVPFAVVLTAVAMTLAVAVLTFARAVRVGAAMTAFGVLMSFAVMRAVRFRRVVKRAGEVLCDSLVRCALDAGIDADAG